MAAHFFKSIVLSCLLLLCANTFAAALIDPFNSSWKYLDDGSDQSNAWQENLFDDSSWSSTPSFILNGTPGGTTTYFRHNFTVSDPSAYLNLDLTIYRDDGAIVYINGTEVYRNNMPAGSIAYDTLAMSEVLPGDETTPVTTTLSGSILQSGVNTIAVEIHQDSTNNPDITFGLQLNGDSIPDSIVRGPYLQIITPTSAIIRWRTPVANDTKVNYGRRSDNLNKNISDTTASIEHEIKLTGLRPATTYYYNIGTTTNVLGSGSDHFFKTQPRVGKHSPTRIWVIGDSGTGTTSQTAVYNGYKNHVNGTYANLWLMLGDNAYNTGTDAEYQTTFFEVYETLLRQTVVWPALGNHDGYSVDTPAQTGPYYEIFTLPKLGEAGGVASQTESYYSYDYGNIHFVVLNSYDEDRSTTANMATWLNADLTATKADWIIAYWHHPPYSKGSHDSDAESELIEMRENILPILEQHSVDLVLAGHSHSYERSKFIDNHYGDSSTYLDSTYAISTHSGNPGIGDTAYTKIHPSITHGGTVYAVAGTSGGQSSFGNVDHPIMFYASLELGSMVIDVNNLLLSARFINRDGVVRDSFNIQKYRCSRANLRYVKTHNQLPQYLQVCPAS